MPLYTHYKRSAVVGTLGFYVGDYGSEAQVIAPSGELFNKVAKTDGVVHVGPMACTTSGGTYTLTRNAASDYSKNKTAAADTTYITTDITSILRNAASKGLKLTSIDVAYSIGTLAITTHSLAVNAVTYANNTAVAVAAHGGTVTGTLATATQANPYLTTLTLGTPTFMNTVDTKVNIELTVVAAATSVYNFYGFILYFTHDYI